MKILLTGASGFLGKWVLKLLLERPEVTEVQVISRSKHSHPDPRVRVIRKDLSDPALLNHVSTRMDATLHLAGLYQFGTSFPENYRANVLGTQNLLDAIRRFAPSRILHASSYAVGIGQPELKNARLPELPSKDRAYAYTKALAERLMEQAHEQLGQKVEIFRLGILVGDSRLGTPEKLDGPYGFYKNLIKISRFAPEKMPLWIPADPEAILPLVAVDEAARVMVNALFSNPESRDYPIYHAVYRPDSVKASELLASFVEQLEQQSHKRLIPFFKPVSHPSVLKTLERALGSQAENFLYAQWKVALEEGSHQTELSHWSALKKSFFAGAQSGALK
jgi:nucleoside-diphosphate-sugar epimerase